MIAAVIPVHKEEYRIGRVLDSLLSISAVKKIILVLNGSNGLTRKEAHNYYQNEPGKITLVSFDPPLGIDVPRAVGAKLAYAAGAAHTLFIDGDMVGEISNELTIMLNNAERNSLDLSLLDC